MIIVTFFSSLLTFRPFYLPPPSTLPCLLPLDARHRRIFTPFFIDTSPTAAMSKRYASTQLRSAVDKKKREMDTTLASSCLDTNTRKHLEKTRTQLQRRDAAEVDVALLKTKTVREFTNIFETINFCTFFT